MVIPRTVVVKRTKPRERQEEKRGKKRE